MSDIPPAPPRPEPPKWIPLSRTEGRELFLFGDYIFSGRPRSTGYVIYTVYSNLQGDFHARHPEIAAAWAESGRIIPGYPHCRVCLAPLDNLMVGMCTPCDAFWFSERLPDGHLIPV